MFQDGLPPKADSVKPTEAPHRPPFGADFGEEDFPMQLKMVAEYGEKIHHHNSSDEENDDNNTHLDGPSDKRKRPAIADFFKEYTKLAIKNATTEGGS